MISWITRLRPLNLVIIALTQFFFFTFVLVPFVKSNGLLHKIDYIDHFLIILITCLTCGGGYIINDIYDRAIDSVNKPEKVIENVKQWRNIYIILFLISCVTTLYLTLKYANYWFIIILLISWGALWAYSVKLKCIPLAGNILVAFFSAIVVPAILGLSWEFISKNNGDLSSLYLPFSFYFIFAFLISLIREIMKDIEDVNGDKSCGCNTIAVVEGIDRTRLWAIFFTIIFLVTLIVWQVKFINQISLVFVITVNLLISIPSFLVIPLINKAENRAFAQSRLKNYTNTFSGISKILKGIMVMGILCLLILIFL